MSISPKDYRSRRRVMPDVLFADGHYVHCGQPMQSVSAEMNSFRSIYNNRNLPEALGAYLVTRVLRCQCGFQMEIPDQSTLW